MIVGDSKSAYISGVTGGRLSNNSTQVLEVGRFAVSGDTVAKRLLETDTDITGFDSKKGDPDIILINLGSNDSANMVDETTWKTGYINLIAKYHTRWNNAQIYLAQVWRGATAADCNTLDTWIEDLVSLQIYLHLGIDERTFLPSVTADNVHPTDPSGYIEMCNQWKTVLGLP